MMSKICCKYSSKNNNEKVTVSEEQIKEQQNASNCCIQLTSHVEVHYIVSLLSTFENAMIKNKNSAAYKSNYFKALNFRSILLSKKKKIMCFIAYNFLIFFNPHCNSVNQGFYSNFIHEERDLQLVSSRIRPPSQASQCQNILLLPNTETKVVQRVISGHTYKETLSSDFLLLHNPRTEFPRKDKLYSSQSLKRLILKGLTKRDRF